jgi:hypothetical protein
MLHVPPPKSEIGFEFDNVLYFFFFQRFNLTFIPLRHIMVPRLLMYEYNNSKGRLPVSVNPVRNVAYSQDAFSGIRTSIVLSIAGRFVLRALLRTRPAWPPSQMPLSLSISLSLSLSLALSLFLSLCTSDDNAQRQKC